MIKAFWHQSSNFGDKLTPYVLSKLGIEHEYCDKGAQEEHYIFCGSILSACNEHSIVWGAGQAQFQPTVQPKQLLACRGAKTREMLLSQDIECPEVYGDFGMILPLAYQPADKEKRRKIAFIPHVADLRLFYDPFDINGPVEQTIDHIVQSEMVCSSSLHVLITAYAYGVPFQWIRSENVIGADFKFYDFLETDYDLAKFVDVCPFKEHLKQ